jgi:DNA polymerase
MAGLDISRETAQAVVSAYRNTYPEVVKFWYNQEAMAIKAVRNAGEIVEALGGIYWKVQGNFLYCRLPSGRCLAYSEPIVKTLPTKWGTDKDTLTFMAVNPVTKKWERQHTYGGMLTENIVQATARDLMANGMLNLKKHGYTDIIMTVHDEVVAEVKKDFGSVKEFETLLATTPEWAKSYPIKAEGWRGPRYKK